MAATAPKKKTKVDFVQAINESMKTETVESAEVVVAEEQTKDKDETKPIKKVGRPSNGPVEKITLAIPEELFKDVEVAAALFHKGNKTAYINALIKKDLEVNLEKYKQFKEMMEE